jgi:hypothetical protein
MVKHQEEYMYTRSLVTLLTAALLLGFILPAGGSTAAPALEPEQGHQVLFIENVGQFHPDVRFLVHLESGPMYVTQDSLWLGVISYPERNSEPDELPLPFPQPAAPAAGAWVKVSFSGASPQTRLTPSAPGDTTYSYFTGSDPEQWHSAVPVWSTVSMVDLYPGLTLEVSAPGGQLRMLAQANTAQALQALEIQVEGAETAALGASSGGNPTSLRLSTPAGEVDFPLVETALPNQLAPTISGEEGQAVVTAPYTALTPQSPAAAAGVKKWYEYSTFLGGQFGDGGQSIAANKWGAAYVTGQSSSYDFPHTPGAFDPTFNGNFDVFAVRIDPSGERLLYATFLGGRDYDIGSDLALAPDGSVYLVGLTRSGDFPVSSGAYDTVNSSSGKGFVAHLSPSGTALHFSTLIGGNTDWNNANAVAVDPEGRIYVVGYTQAADFPVTPNALDNLVQSGDAFLTVFQRDGKSVLFSTLLGGELNDYARDVYAAGLNRVYVVGTSASKDFPHTPYAYDRKVSTLEGFVACYDLTRPKLVYATMLGGKHWDEATAVVADKEGYAYVSGYTYSRDFPTTPGAYQSTLQGESDAFLVKLSPDGRRAVYATQLGGSGSELNSYLAVDRSGAVYMTGYTTSPDFPVTTGPDPFALLDANLFVVKFARDGSRPVFSTVMGGSGWDVPSAISLGASGSVFVTGTTESLDFPTTPNVLDSSFTGAESGGEGFVTRLWVQNQPPKDPALMTADELYLEEDQASEPVLYRLFLPLIP